MNSSPGNSSTVYGTMLGVLLSCITTTLFWSDQAHGQMDRYRVEVLVFRHLNTPSEPIETRSLSLLREAYELSDETPGPVPRRLEESAGTFSNLWSRLSRLADYEPLARLTFEQSQFDYHPAVRLHDEEIIGSRITFPGNLVYLNTDETGSGATSADWLAPYRAPVYRLDGTIRLRHSRFLHIDLDLEYRLDEPAPDPDDLWLANQSSGMQLPDRETALAQKALTELPAPAQNDLDRSGTGTSPSIAIDTTQSLGKNKPGSPATGSESPAVLAMTVTTPGALHNETPLRVYRLQQSRQVSSNSLEYFDTAYLSALVRITPIEANNSEP